MRTLTAASLVLGVACEHKDPGPGPADAGGVYGCPVLTEAPDASAHPPPSPDAPAATGAGVVFGIRKLMQHDPFATGEPEIPYGYDLDGFDSSKCSSNHCRARLWNGAAPTDGPGGIDNAFGRGVLAVYVGIRSDIRERINEGLQRGDYTLLVVIDNLGADTDATGLAGAIYQGAPLGHAPAWDGTDVWPVFCESLETCLSAGTPPPPANASTTPFHNAYVANGVLVVRPEGPVEIGLNWLGGWFPLRLHNAVITMRLGTGGPTPQSATSGVIAGVVNTEEYLAGIEAHLADFCGLEDWACQYACDSPTKDAILEQIREASDIMSDGSQDPDAVCDGISVGLGFEAAAVQLGSAADRQPPATDPCAN